MLTFIFIVVGLIILLSIFGINVFGFIFEILLAILGGSSNNDGDGGSGFGGGDSGGGGASGDL